MLLVIKYIILYRCKCHFLCQGMNLVLFYTDLLIYIHIANKHLHFGFKYSLVLGSIVVVASQSVNTLKCTSSMCASVAQSNATLWFLKSSISRWANSLKVPHMKTPDVAILQIDGPRRRNKQDNLLHKWNHMLHQPLLRPVWKPTATGPENRCDRPGNAWVRVRKQSWQSSEITTFG